MCSCTTARSRGGVQEPGGEPEGGVRGDPGPEGPSGFERPVGPLRGDGLTEPPGDPAAPQGRRRSGPEPRRRELTRTVGRQDWEVSGWTVMSPSRRRWAGPLAEAGK